MTHTTHYEVPSEVVRDEECVPDTLRTITPLDTARAALDGVALRLGRDDLFFLVRIARALLDAEPRTQDVR
jgi:hypothetical protein